MKEYLVDIYRIHRQANGDIFAEKNFSKVLNENVVKHAKQANKEVGYKYVGRFKDIYGNYYTQYERKDEELSTKECEVIYKIKITRL
jgi:hypothetical protein